MGRNSDSYASGHSTSYSLADAKRKCIELGTACKAVTCSRGGTSCTVRASTSLGRSSSGETTYTPDCSANPSGGCACQPVGCAGDATGPAGCTKPASYSCTGDLDAGCLYHRITNQLIFNGRAVATPGFIFSHADFQHICAHEQFHGAADWTTVAPRSCLHSGQRLGKRTLYSSVPTLPACKAACLNDVTCAAIDFMQRGDCYGFTDLCTFDNEGGDTPARPGNEGSHLAVTRGPMRTVATTTTTTTKLTAPWTTARAEATTARWANDTVGEGFGAAQSNTTPSAQQGQTSKPIATDALGGNESGGSSGAAVGGGIAAGLVACLGTALVVGYCVRKSRENGEYTLRRPSTRASAHKQTPACAGPVDASMDVYANVDQEGEDEGYLQVEGAVQALVDDAYTAATDTAEQDEQDALGDDALADESDPNTAAFASMTQGGRLPSCEVVHVAPAGVVVTSSGAHADANSPLGKPSGDSSMDGEAYAPVVDTAEQDALDGFTAATVYTTSGDLTMDDDEHIKPVAKTENFTSPEDVRPSSSYSSTGTLRHSVYVEACAYFNDKRRSCKRDAMVNADKPGNIYCEKHTCPAPDCAEPKPSRAQFCPTHGTAQQVDI